MELKGIKILLIEDNPGDIRLVQEIINEEKNDRWQVMVTDRLSQGQEWLATDSINVVLLDLALPDSTGINTFKQVQAKAPGVPIIVLTISNDEEVATQAIHEGAQDYLVKGQFDRHMLTRSISYSMERKSLLMEKDRLIAKQRELLTDIKVLNGLLPICSYCKKIRDDQGYWDEVEHYILTHTAATFTHGICPKCAQDSYPEIGKEKEDDADKRPQ